MLRPGFALTRVHELAPQHPEWRQRDPFQAVLTNDRAAMAKFSESDWEVILAATPRRNDHRSVQGAGEAVVGDGQEF